MYYNTTKQDGNNLKSYKSKALSQEDKILNYFTVKGKATPTEIWSGMSADALLTSVRRSITNLTKSGRLTKTKEKKTSIYGRPEYVWEFNLEGNL
tara:strand:- start:159 stop:443 length:285 start_codon:yes stop_codon:yes gene_type:complete